MDENTKKRGGRHQRVLQRCAMAHGGFVSVREAAQLGVSAPRLAEQVRSGLFERVDRGLYRLVDHPHSELDEYHEAVRWPGIDGVLLFGESALELWGVCDIQPAAIHVAVPNGFRTRRQVPRGYQLHRAEIDERASSERHGVPTTTLDRTIRDCLALGTRRDLLHQAITAGAAARYIAPAEASELHELLELGRRTR